MTPQKPRGLDRRSLLRTSLLTGLGAVALSTASQTAAQAASESASSPNGLTVTFNNTQTKWRWCGYCGALFYCSSGNSAPRCPSSLSDVHVAGSSTVYSVPMGSDTGNTWIQPWWWWCNHCNGLFYSGTGNPTGYCAGNINPNTGAVGPHNLNASGDYELMFNDAMPDRQWNPLPGGPSIQANWSWCRICYSLFWSYGSEACPGVPNAGPHNKTGSSIYTLFD
jgi:hypothetical protein